ncbi:MAG TPA: DUF4401 domain-containing protein [Allosphingosinicella sp.]
MSAAELWTRLAAAGRVEGEQPPAAAAESPWYVRAMLGAAGWIGALFLAVFIATAFYFIVDDSASAMIAGAIFCGAAFGLFMRFDGNDFVEQFALVVSLLGQVMLGIGLAQLLERQEAAFYLSVAAVEVVLALAIPNFLHRVLAACGAAVALALAINELQLHGLTAPILCAGLAWIWLDPARWATGGSLWRPVGYGLVLALLLVETFRLAGGPSLLGMATERPGWIAIHGPLIGRGLTAAVLVWVAFALARREGFAANGRVALAAAGAALLLGLLSLGAPGFASALIVLLLGFAAGNRLLLALGIFGLLGFVSHFYYSLHATLLEKSGLLAATGVLLLAAHFLLRRFHAAAAAPETADA